MEKLHPNYDPVEYFTTPINPCHKQYIALRAVFVDKMSAEEVAAKFEYTVSTVYSLIRDFKERLKSGIYEDPFFKLNKPGRKQIDTDGSIVALIVTLRKRYLSVPEIKTILDSKDIVISQRYISSVLKDEGFVRLPRRDSNEKKDVSATPLEKIIASKSRKLTFEVETFSSQSAGLLCFLPYMKKYGIDKAVQLSDYPKTQDISKLSSILCFLALKLSNVRRYCADDTWCMDRGMGLFAGLNVLPKTAWYSSYSSSITRGTNISFLKSLNSIWKENGLLSDTVNIDFTALPYWGDEDPFENNWSGKRNKALASMLALIAQDPDSGIICYGDTTIRHDNQSEAILEFLDFYKSDKKTDTSLKYLVFDSKVTTYQNLNNLSEEGIKFITIRRRCNKLVDRINEITSAEWKIVRIERANSKGRNIKAFEENLAVKGYKGKLRHIYITGNGKIKPAIIITNDFDLLLSEIVRKYSKRWLVEKEISEQIEFFHLNRNSSGMVIKVDFDFTMTILAHNLYRLFAKELDGFSHCADQTIFDKFVDNSGEIKITDASVEVFLKKKRNLPLLLEQMQAFSGTSSKISWLKNSAFKFLASTTT
ncbi:MAG: putative orf [uncultured bacterium]|nr:MAG: putative orf [uncultured bacterium]